MSPASGAPGDEPTRTARPPGGRWAVLSSGGPRIAAYAALALLLVVLPLSGFLFGSGGVLFQNWNWSISPARIVPAPSVLDPYLWNPAGPDAAGYTRAITAWPPFLLLGATHDPFAIERAYLAFVYLVEFGLAFIGGTLLLRLVPELPRGATREALRMAFIGASFVNPAALQWEAGVVVPFLWGSSLIAIALLATLRVTRSGDLRSALLAGVSLGVGATLDPRILAWGALGMGIVLAIEAVRLRGVARMVRPVGVAAVGALPGALLTAFAYVWTGAIEGAPIRSGTYDAIATASTNSGPLRVLELLGYNISGLTYAPPTVLGAALHGANTSLLGVPPFLWLDGSLVGSLWLFLLAVPPVLAFGALLDRRQRALALPLAAVALASGLLAMGTQAPSDALVQAEVALGGIQFAGFGSVVQTIVGVPSWIQVLTEAAYLPLFGLGLAALLRPRPTRAEGASPGPQPGWRTQRLARLPRELVVRYRRPVAAIAVVALLLGSWQFFTGSFYPAGLSPGVSADEIPSVGALAPSSPPASDVNALSTLASDPGRGTVYWPGPDSYAYPWNPKWSPGVAYAPGFVPGPAPGLSYLLSNGWTGDIAPLLAADGVASLVVDNMSSPGLALAFGTGDRTGLVANLSAAPGVRPESVDPGGASVFDLAESPGLVSFATGALDPLLPVDLVGEPIAALAGAGIHPVLLAAPDGAMRPSIAFLDPGQSLDAGSAVVATVENLSTFAPGSGLSGFAGPGATPAAESYASTGDYPLPAPYGNWTVALWSLPAGSLDLSVGSDGPVTFHRNGSAATESLNYGSSLVDGSARGIAIDPGSRVAFTVSYAVRALAGFHGSVWANVVSSNASLINTGQLSETPSTPGPAWSTRTFSGALPTGSSVFTLRLFSNFSGAFEVENVSIGWSELRVDPAGLTGVTEGATNLSVQLHATADAPPYLVAAQLNSSGNASVGAPGTSASPRPIDRTDLGWVALGTVPAGSSGISIRLQGGIELGGLLVAPADAAPGANTTVGAIAVGSDFSVSTSYSSPAAGYLVLHEPPSSRWSMSLDGSAGVSGAPTALGALAFAVPAGTHRVFFSLSGLAAQPVLLGVVGAVLAALAIAAWRPAILLGPIRRAVRAIVRRDRPRPPRSQ